MATNAKKGLAAPKKAVTSPAKSTSKGNTVIDDNSHSGPPSPDPDEIKRQANQICSEEIESLIQACFGVVTEKYLASREIPHCVDRMIENMLVVVQLANFPHDPGELPPDQDSSWRIDAEPIPTPIDNWARGAVPIRKRYKVDLGSMEGSAAPAAGTGRKTSSRPGSGALSPAANVKTGRIKGSATPSPVPTETASSTHSRSPPRTPSMRLKSKSAPPTRTHERSSGPNVRNMLDRKKSAEDESREMAKTDLAVREAMELVHKKLEEEAAHDDERFKQLRKEMEGKEFTYDGKGNVILINPCRADKLPSNSIGVKVKLSGDGQSDEDGRSRSVRSRVGTSSAGSPLKAAGGSRRFKEGDGRDGNASSNVTFIQTGQSTMPAISELFKLQPGVILREGGITRSGPKRAVEGMRMSKGDFNSTFGGVDRRSSAPESQSVSLEAGAGGGGGVSSTVGTVVEKPLADVRNMSPLKSSNESQSPARPDIKAATIADWETGAGLGLGSIPDTDLLASALAADGRAGLQPTTTTTTTKHHHPPPAFSKEQSRTKPQPPPSNNQQRPRSPPILPPKATPNFRESTLGSRSRNPRDRPFMQTSPNRRRPTSPPPNELSSPETNHMDSSLMFPYIPPSSRLSSSVLHTMNSQLQSSLASARYPHEFRKIAPASTIKTINQSIVQDLFPENRALHSTVA